ncbi:MAG: lipoprotein [Bacteroidales bacterium]|nr:lipoprotein [Bacteroidales bacterium]
MKKIFLFLAGAAIALSSCNIGEDGNAFLSIDYSDDYGEPVFVNVSYDVKYDDGRVQTIDLHNSWDWGVYYQIDRGDYTVYWEYEYKNDKNKTIRVGNEAVIEIWIDPGRTKHRDGVDVYFDVVLFDEDHIKFTHEKDTEARHKSYDLTETNDEKTLLYTQKEQKGDYVLNYKVYKVTEYEVE